jgi:hypothetical protein
MFEVVSEHEEEVILPGKWDRPSLSGHRCERGRD